MVDQTEQKVAVVRGEKYDVILSRIKEKVTSWAPVTLEQLNIKKMSGLSNACYRVHIEDEALKQIVPTTLLYRKFECEIIDKKVESTIFKSMSDQGLGPLLHFQNTVYRIESFFEGRPLTIWELRNSTIMKLLAKKAFEFNFNQDAISKISEFKPMNKAKLGLDTAIDEWAQQVRERLPRIQGKLKGKTDEGAIYILAIIDALQQDILYDGAEGFLKELAAGPREGKIVLSHNDAQENNILASLRDAEEMILIDYEYGDWNPMAYDIANFFNEFTVDNAAPLGPFGSGIQYYESNFPSDPEMNILAKEYLKHYYFNVENKEGNDSQFQAWSTEKLPAFMKDVKSCLMLNSFYWCVWSIMMCQEEEECDHTIFNWEFCRMRCILFAKQREWFGYSAHKGDEVGTGNEIVLSVAVETIEKYTNSLK